MLPDNLQRSDLGQRILVYGSSCSGKSTLGAELAGLMDAPFVELDALVFLDLPRWRLIIRVIRRSEALAQPGAAVGHELRRFLVSVRALAPGRVADLVDPDQLR